MLIGGGPLLARLVGVGGCGLARLFVGEDHLEQAGAKLSGSVAVGGGLARSWDGLAGTNV